MSVRSAQWDERVTGILDSSVLSHELEVELARSRRYEHPFALLRIKVAGVDGRLPAEALLHRLSGALRLVVRWSDSVAREAVDQYLLLLRETGVGGARTAAQNLLVALAAELPDAAQTLSFQVHTAAWRKGDHLGALLARLDTESARYRA